MDRSTLILLSSFLLVSSLARGQTPESPQLSLQRIFDSEDFDPKTRDLQWDSTSDSLWSFRKATDEQSAAITRLSVHDLSSTIVLEGAQLQPPGQTEPLSIHQMKWSDDERFLLVMTNAKRVWRDQTRGDFWVRDQSTEQWRQLGKTFSPESLMFAEISPNSTTVAYVVMGDDGTGLYTEDLKTGQVTPIAVDPDPLIIQGTFDWVYEEELGLRKGFSFSPDGSRIAFWRLDTTNVPKHTLIDNTTDRYPSLKAFAYPKVGQTNSAASIGIHHLDSQKTVWAQIEGDAREHYLAAAHWPEVHVPGASRNLFVQQLNRSQSINRLLQVDAETGRCTEVLRETSEGWVTPQSDLHWLSTNKDAATSELVWMSERTGFRQLFGVQIPNDNLTSGSNLPVTQRRLTAGEFDVTELKTVCLKTDEIYFDAAIDHPTQRALYRIDPQSLPAAPQRVSPLGHGTYQTSIGPSCDHAIETYSDRDTPPVQRLVTLNPYAVIETFNQNSPANQNVSGLVSIKREFFRVQSDGVELDGWIMLSSSPSKAGSVPLLVHVYGEPAGQTVVDRWGGANDLWHRYLVQLGMAVVSIDNRGTDSPRGKSFRQAVDGKIGILPPLDQANAVRRVLERYPELDRDRVAVWGWSGGGSTSLHAIFRYPDLYAAAIAVAPVADQLDYDTIYQERYMGLLEENREAYIAGSPITHADKLADPLLLIHGTGDDNVHYGSTERLINRLVALDKTFEMMIYPGRTHSISEGENTSLHLRKTMTDFLIRHLDLKRN